MGLIWQLAEEESDRLLCYQLRSQEYGRHYSNIPKDNYCDHLDTAYLSDGSPQSFTIFVKEEGKEKVMGTMRGSIAYRQGDSKFLHSEIGMLMSLGTLSGRDFIKGIADTPNLNVTAIGEVGKLAIADEVTYDKRSVFQNLWLGVATVGIKYNINLWLAIMPPYVAKFIEKTGIPLQIVLGCRLNREDTNCLKYIVKHHEYFLPKLRNECSFENEILDVSEMKKFVLNCTDGVNLYWLTTKQALTCFETWRISKR